MKATIFNFSSQFIFILFFCALCSCQSYDTVVGDVSETDNYFGNTGLNIKMTPSVESLRIIEAESKIHADILMSAVDVCHSANVNLSDEFKTAECLTDFFEKFFDSYDSDKLKELGYVLINGDSISKEIPSFDNAGVDVEWSSTISKAFISDDYDKLYIQICEYMESDAFCRLTEEDQQNQYIALDLLCRYRHNLINLPTYIAEGNPITLDFASPGDRAVWRECAKNLTPEMRKKVLAFCLSTLTATSFVQVGISVATFLVDCM